MYWRHVGIAEARVRLYSARSAFSLLWALARGESNLQDENHFYHILASTNLPAELMFILSLILAGAPCFACP